MSHAGQTLPKIAAPDSDGCGPSAAGGAQGAPKEWSGWTSTTVVKSETDVSSDCEKPQKRVSEDVPAKFLRTLVVTW